MSLFDITKVASQEVDQTSMQRTRTKYSVLASTMSELGELAEEIAIAEKHSYKKQGSDGVVGEAVDTIICLLDLIHVHNPSVTEEELNHIAQLKLDKWVAKAASKR
jgi:hypothetical protein